MSTAHDLPLDFGEPLAAPALRLVPAEPLDFDDVVRRVRPRLQRYAVRRLGDSHEAEELVQEALLRAYTHREQLLTEDDLSAWTTVVTGRLVIDRLRVRGRSTSVAEVPEDARMGRDTADVVVGRDEARTALDALDAMPVRQASLLWAREIEGQSYDELCSRFGMTEPAVRSILTRARKALRKEYALRGGTLPVGGLAVLAPWIAGMTWADKLRAAVGRVTAPAALAAVGITTLGGLILSPFGAFPSPSPGTFAPSHAVVATVKLTGTEPATPHYAFNVRTPQTLADDRRGESALAPEGIPPGGTVVDRPGAPGDITSFNCEKKYSLPIVGGGVYGSDCTPSKGSEIRLVPTLPDNPTGIRAVTVRQDIAYCPTIASNPVVQCTDAP